jgi:hypothetical protein
MAAFACSYCALLLVMEKVEKSLATAESQAVRAASAVFCLLPFGISLAPLTSHSTDCFARPPDGIGKALLIWLDKKAVDLYSRAKARFGFSDDFASKVLGFLSGKK